MIVGLVPALAADKDVLDAEALRQLGCTKIFNQDRPHVVPDRVIEFLRPDDMLAVTDLSQLAASLDQLVSFVERLYKAGVTIYAVRDGIGPDVSAIQYFGRLCCTLAEFGRTRAEHLQRSKAAKLTRKRGRPPLLGRNDRIRAETLLKTGRASVTDVARLLGVSSATIYRHFPRRKAHPEPDRFPPLQATHESEAKDD